MHTLMRHLSVVINLPSLGNTENSDALEVH